MAKNTIKQPDDFDSVEDFLKYARELFREDYEDDTENREAELEDAKFMVGCPWDEEIKQLRDADGKPTLTINPVPAFIGQLIGNRRLNDTVFKFIPDHGGTKEIAKLREGIARFIQKTARARRAYNNAFQCQSIGGLGWFRLSVDYNSDDVFEQDILVNTIMDSQSVVMDRFITDPTGRDAKHCFVLDAISATEYEQRYNDVEKFDFESATTAEDLGSTSWLTRSDVRIAEFWRMRTRERQVAMLAGGKIVDITDEYEEDGDGNKTLNPEILNQIQTKPNGEPFVRNVQRPYAEMYVMSGNALLEGPYRLPISRVPVFRVPGWEVLVGKKRFRWGVVRFMKDPIRFMNYFRSMIVEKIMQSPKAKFIAADDAVEGYENDWRNAHLNDDPLLKYRGDSGNPPQRIEPIQIEPALIQAATMAMQDLKDITNLHEASLGQTSNEVSGKAIVARQRVGELGTIIYLDNLNMAIEECGSVVNELIPVVYDTPRLVKIMGEDDQEDLVAINGYEETGLDITTGKYAVTVITGPSTATKRVEAAEGMMTFMNHAPDKAALIADLIAEAQDWPGAQKIARRIRATLPPGIVGDEDMSEQQKQQQAAAEQQAAAQAELQSRLQTAQLAKLEAEAEEAAARAREADARAREADARARKAESEIGVAAAKAEAEIDKMDAETDFREAETVHAMFPAKEKKDDRRDEKA